MQNRLTCTQSIRLDRRRLTAYNLLTKGVLVILTHWWLTNVLIWHERHQILWNIRKQMKMSYTNFHLCKHVTGINTNTVMIRRGRYWSCCLECSYRSTPRFGTEFTRVCMVWTSLTWTSGQKGKHNRNIGVHVFIETVKNVCCEKDTRFENELKKN